MKKKSVSSVFLLLLLLVCVVTGTSGMGKKPFQDMTADEIQTVSVLLTPPGTHIELDREEIEQMVGLLHNIIIYQRNFLGNDYNGQYIRFDIEKTNGTKLSIGILNPVLCMDDIYYRVESASCEALSQFANRLK